MIMLLELYISVMILTFVIFFIGFFMHGQPNSELLMALSIILFAVLAFSSLGITKNIPVYNETISSYVVQEQAYPSFPLFGLFLGLGGISILLFYLDVMDKYKGLSNGGVKK